MMERKFKFLTLFLAVILLTGCVKMDVTMEIKSDKSMNFSMIYAVSKEFAEYSDSSDKEQISEYENKGFYVEKYEENDKTGYKISKQYKNIDEVSTEGTLEKTDMTEALAGDNQYMFSVKKGFLKNTYTASYNFNTGGYGSTNGLVEEYYDTCEYTLTDVSCGQDVVPDQEANKAAYQEYIAYQKKQMSEFTEGMDLTFNLKLPYKAKSNNASKVSNGGKELTWNLIENPDVMFEFEIYNMNNVYIAGGVSFLVIFAIFICLISIRGNKNRPSINGSVREIGFMQNEPFTQVDPTPTEFVNNDTANNSFSNPVNPAPMPPQPPVQQSSFVPNSGLDNSVNNTSYNQQPTGNYSSPTQVPGQSQIGIEIPPMTPTNNDQNNQ